MTITVIDFGTPAFDEVIRLRQEVLWQPLDLEFSEKDIEAEYDDLHIGCYNAQSRLIACLSVSNTVENVAIFSQVVVALDAQKKQVGSQMLKYTEKLLQTIGYTQTELSAKAQAVPFYQKLGYQILGAQFFAKGIAHYTMIKAL